MNVALAHTRSAATARAAKETVARIVAVSNCEAKTEEKAERKKGATCGSCDRERKAVAPSAAFVVSSRIESNLSDYSCGERVSLVSGLCAWVVRDRARIPDKLAGLQLHSGLAD